MLNTILFPFKYIQYLVSYYFRYYLKWNYYKSIKVPYLELMRVSPDTKQVFYRFKYSGKPTPPDAIMNLGKNAFTCQFLVEEINRDFIEKFSNILSKFDKTKDIKNLPIKDLLKLEFEHNGNKVIVYFWGTMLTDEWLKYHGKHDSITKTDDRNLPDLVRNAIQSQKTKLELYQEGYHFY